jgi:adenylate cyclase
MTLVATSRKQPLLPPGIRKALRSRHQWRLWSGLVLFGYAASHFLNHMLGLVSLQVMESVEWYRWWFWHLAPATVLLYGAFLVHIGLGLWSVAARATWRMPAWEATQIGLGLMIPVLIVDHIIATRILSQYYGFHDSYEAVLRGLWPNGAIRQSLLLLIVWAHGCIGLHHWLKLMPSYRRHIPWLAALAALVPALAIAGFASAGREVARNVYTQALRTPLQDQAFAAWSQFAETALLVLALAVIAAIVGGRILTRIRPGIAVSFAGDRLVKVQPGATLLEIARAHGVRQTAVCGGRARCTTCRVRVVEGAGHLPAPAQAEAAALARIGAPEGVRLACQVRPTGDVAVRPLVPVATQAVGSTGDDPYRWGVERRITVMFTDIRGFTALAEQLYPYDAVFLLNRYFEAMAQVVARHGGVVDKFMGDGIMALFGVTPSIGAGARDALLAARDMVTTLDMLNREFAGTLKAPLRIGIGLHTGPAVLGRVGAGGSLGAGEGRALTALGDTVNIASRLEALTKTHDAIAIVSGTLLEASGLMLPEAEHLDLDLRGRSQTLGAIIVRDFAGLADRTRAA